MTITSQIRLIVTCWECAGSGWVEDPCEGRGGGIENIACDNCHVKGSGSSGYVDQNGRPWSRKDLASRLSDIGHAVDAVVLTELEVRAVESLLKRMGENDFPPPMKGTKKYFPYLLNDSDVWPEQWRGLEKCGERDCCIRKMKRIGLVEHDA